MLRNRDDEILHLAYQLWEDDNASGTMRGAYWARAAREILSQTDLPIPFAKAKSEDICHMRPAQPTRDCA